MSHADAVTEWTFNDETLTTGNVVPDLDQDDDRLGLTLLLTRAKKRTFAALAEYAGRLQVFEPPLGPTLVIDGSPNGENLVALLVPDTLADLVRSGWYLWEEFSNRAAGLADRLPATTSLRLIAVPDGAEGVCSATVSSINNDFSLL